MNSISLLIPAYNEADKIENSLLSIYRYLQSDSFLSLNLDYEVLLLDDGSTDATKLISENAIKKNNLENFKLVKLPHRGKAPTLIAGFNMAKNDLVLMCDADLAVPISELNKFVKKIKSEKLDIVIASREGEGASREGEPFIRHLMGRIFNTIIRIILGLNISDTQCGFKLFKKANLMSIVPKILTYKADDAEIDKAQVSGFDTEILYIAKKLNFKIGIIPTYWKYGENSKVSKVRDSLNNLKDVLAIFINNIFKKYD